MILVDTSVWAAFYNGAASAQVERLDRALQSEAVGIAPVILTEVLQGFRTERGFETARRLLTALPMLALDAAGHVDAARLFRSLRRRGVTVRGAVDCIIAQTCLSADVELLAADRDFTLIARHTKLRLCSVP